MVQLSTSRLTRGRGEGYACANIDTLLATLANPVAAQLKAELAQLSVTRNQPHPRTSNLQALPDGGQILAW